MAKTINIAINTASLVGLYQLHYLLCFIIIIVIMTDVVLGCTLVCYMPHKKDFVNLQKIIPTAICPYDCLQNDVLEYQSRGAQILVCGDFNARTAEEPDFLKTAELQSFLPTAPDDDELPAYILPRHNQDTASGSHTWN